MPRAYLLVKGISWRTSCHPEESAILTGGGRRVPAVRRGHSPGGPSKKLRGFFVRQPTDSARQWARFSPPQKGASPEAG
jgi:hypothetical protein